jgi:hypothetical protein
MNARPADDEPGISLATRPAREIVAEFENLDEAFEALDALAAKRVLTRGEWLAAIRSPRDRDAAEPGDGT